MQNSKSVLVGVVAIVIIGLGGWQLGLFKHQKTPTELLSAAFTNFSNRSGSSAAMDLKVTLYKDATDTTGYTAGTMHIDGASSVPSGAQTSADIKAKFNISSTISPDPLGSINVDLGAEFRMIGKTFYLKVSKIPLTPFFDVSKIRDKWFLIDPVALLQESGDQSAIDRFNALFDDKGGDVKQQYLTKVTELYTQYPFMINPVFNGTQKVGDVTVKNVTFTIDKDKLASFMLEFLKYQISLDPQTKDVPSDLKKQDFDDALTYVDFGTITVGINTHDDEPYLISDTMKFASPQDDSIPRFDVSIKGTWADFNKPVTVDVPEGAQSIETLLPAFEPSTPTPKTLKTH